MNSDVMLERMIQGYRPWLILFFLCMLVYLPGITTLPPVGRDEARFAQASRQMLQDQDYIRIRFQDELRNKKPAGVYWLQAASAALFSNAESNQIWPYRVPGVLGATLSVFLTFAIGRFFFKPEVALVGAGFLAVSILLIVEAHLATTDACLLAATMMAQLGLAGLYISHQKGVKPPLGLVLCFWVAQGIGILVKGPIVPLVALLTILMLWWWEGRLLFLRRCGWWYGIPLAMLIALPWFIAVSRATDGAFLRESMQEDFLPKLISGHQSHGAPPGYHLLFLMGTFWPGSIFLPAVFWASWKHRQEYTPYRFLLAWMIPTWVLFELLPTKLPHYILPTFPALALLSASILLERENLLHGMRTRWYLRLPRALWMVLLLGVGTILVVVPIILEQKIFISAFFSAGVTFGLLYKSLGWYRNNHFRTLALASMLACPLILAPALLFVFPNLQLLWLSRDIATKVNTQAQLQEIDQPVFAATGYHEPDLVFLLGTKTRLTDPAGAAATIAEETAAFALVTNELEEEFQNHLKSLKIQAKVIDSIQGFNFSKGRWRVLNLYQRKNDQPPHTSEPEP